MERVGLIAGSGCLPLIFAEELRRVGYSVTAVAHTEETFPDLAERVDKIFWVRVGQLGRLISLLKKEAITRAVMAGGINKARFFSSVRPDLRSLKILMRVRERKDDLLLRAVAEELEGEGITIEAATFYVPSLLAPFGNFASRSPTRQEWEDLQFGLCVGRVLGEADVGHCIVVKKGVVLAFEAIEGTDETIRRAGRFASGAVVVKVSKPQQDFRFDLPTVGPETVRVMNEVEASCLGVEAGRTVTLERTAMIARADAAGIALVGLGGDEIPSSGWLP